MNSYPIEAVLPHEHPMILIDQLHSYDQQGAVCLVTITEQSNFFDANINGVPSYVGLEYMAQTIAAFANANQLDKGGEVEIGFLVGSRKYKPQVPVFNLHSELTVSVNCLYQEENGLGAFECKISQQAKVLAEAKISVFQPDEAEKFITEQA